MDELDSAQERLARARSDLVRARAALAKASSAYFGAHPTPVSLQVDYVAALQAVDEAEASLARIRREAGVEGEWISRPDVYCYQAKPRYQR